MKRRVKLAIVEAAEKALENLTLAHTELAKEGIAADGFRQIRADLGSEISRLKRLFFHGGKGDI